MALTRKEDSTIGKEILKTGGSLKQKLSTLASILFENAIYFRYLEMAKCLIDQYNNYTIKELGNMRVNGEQTQVDNI